MALMLLRCGSRQLLIDFQQHPKAWKRKVFILKIRGHLSTGKKVFEGQEGALDRHYSLQLSLANKKTW